MERNADTIIMAYEQADADATELLKYVESISTPEELNDSKLPSLVTNLQDKDSSVSQKYIKGASILGGSVAIAIGASVSTGLLTSGLAVGGAAAFSGAAALGGTVAASEIGMAMIPGLNLFVVPVIAVPLAIKLLKNAKVKKYIKEHKDDLKQKMNKMKKYKEQLVIWLKDLQIQAVEINDKLQKEINLKFNEYKDKTKKLATDISIQIDDCMNTNTNNRILQYNEVILNQYKLQKDLEEKVDFLFDEYNKLLKQKQELDRQIGCLIKLLNAMGCPEAVISQALNESEE